MPSLLTLLLLLGGLDRAALLRRFAHEPTIEVVQQAAVRHFQLRSRWNSWRVQARWAPLLPTRFQVRYGNDATYDLSITDSGEKLTNRVDNDSDRRLLFVGEWNLSLLIFNPVVTKIAETALKRAQRRQSLLILVTKLYYRRRRLQVLAWLQPGATRAERVIRQLQIAQLTALLNGLCGGVFGRTLKRKRSP